MRVRSTVFALVAVVATFSTNIPGTVRPSTAPAGR
jgi:hypothetical protein